MKQLITEEMMHLTADEIEENPKQVRKYFDEGKLSILTDSIKEIGIETPMKLVWRPNNGKKAMIVDGGRRFRSARRAGIKDFYYGKDFIYSEVKDDDMKFKSLLANCMREDLQPAEKGEALFELLKRRGIAKRDIAINAVNRAKDYVDNNMIAEASTRNFYVPADTIKQIARDMKVVGVSGTNAVDLLKILDLPEDIQEKIVFAPPNQRIFKEKMKMNRFGKLVERVGNDRGDLIPMAFGRELVRLGNDRMIRFFLRLAREHNWSTAKLNKMVTDYIDSKMTPEQYIEAYKPRGVIPAKLKVEELRNFICSVDNFTSTLTSFRTINLVAMADQFHQKMFLISGMGLREATARLKEALDATLLTAKQVAKIKEKERKEILKLPFRVKLTSTAKCKRPAYRFSIPIEVGRKIEEEIGELKEGMDIELQINAIIR